MESLMHNVVQDRKTDMRKVDIDAFVLHKWLGLPLFLVVFLYRLLLFVFSGVCAA